MGFAYFAKEQKNVLVATVVAQIDSTKDLIVQPAMVLGSAFVILINKK